MKTSTKTKLFALIGAGVLTVNQAVSQTYLSGTGTNNCTIPAGTTGSAGTFIGCGAGAANTGSDNSVLGYQAFTTNTTGFSNSAFGYQALTANTTGSINSAFGFDALFSNTTGGNNNAFGQLSLELNQTGNFNTAFGDHTLSGNTVSGSSAFGYNALQSNTTGLANTGIGYWSLQANTTGAENTSVGYQSLKANNGGNNNGFGYQSLMKNTSGADNTAIGYAPLFNNTTGSSNTALGGGVAGSVITSGSNNTFLGYATNVSAAGATLTYQAAIGSGAINNQGANTMMFGNSAAVGLYTPNGIFATSDGRFKKNVKEDVKGLAFIKKLRPVTYNMDTKALNDFFVQDLPDSIKVMHNKGMDFSASTAIVHSGFIAQEVEQAQKDAGFTSSIVSHPATSGANYALNYAEIVVPLVKGMQEQQAMIEAQQKQIEALTKLVTSFGTAQNTNSTTSVGSSNISLNDGEIVVLNQNVPNPFAEQTVITYNIPLNAGTAQIMFYDMSGKQIKTINISTKGKGQTSVFANDLSNGTYSYSLIIDGKVVDTKKMIKQQ